MKLRDGGGGKNIREEDTTLKLTAQNNSFQDFLKSLSSINA